MLPQVLHATMAEKGESMRQTFIAIFGFTLITVTGTAAAQENPEELLVPTKVNPVSSADDFRKVARQCMYENEACKTTVEALGSVVGIPPGAIVETMKFADSVGLGVTKKGNETWYDIPTPNGYFLCRLYLKTRSVAPNDESDSPIFDFTANQDGIRVYTLIDPPTIVEGGNAWWDGELVGYYLKRAGREWRLLSGGKAYEPRVNRLLDKEKSPGCVFDNGFQIRYACKGAGNPRDGYPACGEGWLHSDLTTSSHSKAPRFP